MHLKWRLDKALRSKEVPNEHLPFTFSCCCPQAEQIIDADRISSPPKRQWLYRVATSPSMWQAWLMAKSNLTAREKSRQERERAKSLEDRSRQVMRKAAQLQQKTQQDDIRQAAAGIAKEVGNGK